MFEVVFTVNGVEAARNVRAESEQAAVSRIYDEFPEACIVRVAGPWTVNL